MQLDNVYVIGGGRWARVLIDVLCEILPSCVKMYVCTLSNAADMKIWAAEKTNQSHIEVIEELPKFEFRERNIVIVANAARDHFKTAEWVINSHQALLVEKPLAISYEECQYLVRLAQQQNVKIALSQIFLFARYFEYFQQKILNIHDILAINFYWRDSKLENRYGELKSYDSSLPIYADILPHVLPLLAKLTSNQNQKCESIHYLKGGSQLNLDVKLGSIPCRIELERNGRIRQRLIQVTTKKGKINLNFSSEPGIISFGTETINGDPDWETKERPLKRMLGVFFNWATNDEFDERLDIQIAVKASQIIDQVAIFYRRAQKSWLVWKLSESELYIDDDLRYGLYEMLQHNKRYPEIVIDEKIRNLIEILPNIHFKEDLISNISKTHDYIDFLNMKLG